MAWQGGGVLPGPLSCLSALLPKHPKEPPPPSSPESAAPKPLLAQMHSSLWSWESNPQSQGSLCRAGAPGCNVGPALCEAFFWRPNFPIPGPALRPPWSFARAGSLGVSDFCSDTGVTKFSCSTDHQALQLGSIWRVRLGSGALELGTRAPPGSRLG